MIRATTPTHNFTFDIPAAEFDKILVTYTQSGQIVKELNKEDLTIDENMAWYKFTEDDTKLFEAKKPVSLQVRCSKDDTSLATKVITLSVEDVLDDKNLIEVDDGN